MLVVGYGISGKSCFVFLRHKGMNVFAYDDTNGNIPDRVTELPGNVDLVVKSPSIPIMEHNRHPVIKQAYDKHIPVLSTFDIFRIYNPNAKIIAVTGTNGKSTTTALICHILQKSGISAEMGGNIGVSYFDMPNADWYVLEMSSYELASSQYLDFEMACILNIEPDHLGFHGTFENYVAAKHRALDNAKLRFISHEDTATLDKYASQNNAITISTENVPSADIYVRENAILNNLTERIAVDLSGFTNLPGKHNHQNIEFAYAICKQFDLPSREIINHIRSFTPLPHRLNVVRHIKNVTLVNDSKATNPGSSARALATFAGRNIFWLVGGRSKKVDPMIYIKDYIAEVQKIYLFGESMDEFETIFKGIKTTVRCETIEKALQMAYRDAKQAQQGGVVLLSPMCASFDQFKSFEQRGDEFVRMVRELE